MSEQYPTFKDENKRGIGADTQPMTLASAHILSLKAQIADSKLEITRLRADRRERIATACLAGMISSPARSGKFEEYAFYAVKYADALIEKLNKEAKS